MQAFWDSLLDDVKLSPPCYVRVIRVLVEIRDGVVDVAGSREADAVRGAIDIGFIKHQVDEGAYEWNDFKHLIKAVVSIVRRVQAPKRDAELQARWVVIETSMTGLDIDQPRVICNSLEFLLDRINVLRIDSANNR